MNTSKTYLAENGLMLALVSVFFLLGAFLIWGAAEVALGLASQWIAAFVAVLFLFDGRAKRRSRQVASKQGLLIERVRYNPAFFDPHHEFYIDNGASIGYREQFVYSYSIKHRFSKTAVWALLMPEIGAKVEYPNGWKLVVKQGRVSDELRRTIEDIASDPLWEKNPVFLEINSGPDKICANWDETNWKIADRLYDMLSKLSEKAE